MPPKHTVALGQGNKNVLILSFYWLVVQFSLCGPKINNVNHKTFIQKLYHFFQIIKIDIPNIAYYHSVQTNFFYRGYIF